MIRIRDIKLPVDSNNEALLDMIAKILCLDMIYPGNSYPDFSFEILRRSIDARKKPQIYYVYTVKLLIGESEENRIIKFMSSDKRSSRLKKMRDHIFTEPLKEFTIPECGSDELTRRPVIVGLGPAGLFAALILARRGFCPVVIERGKSVEERSGIVDNFWRFGRLNPDTNVLFGEGGAGTFSDGKLNTLTKDVNGRNSFVIRTFAEHGAPASILTDAKPHIGTDMLKGVVKSIREEIIRLGGNVLFDTKLTGIDIANGKVRAVKVTDPGSKTERTIDTDICLLCIGHSARDTFKMLYELGIPMEQKSFAVGFRVVHPQEIVNEWQYGVKDASKLGLPPAEYKVTNETGDGRRVYSFCMCPGGFVVNASSEDHRLCVNGMSEHARDGKFANSAIVVAVTPDDFVQDEVSCDHPLAGMYYQRRVENECFIRGGGSIPAQRFADFEADTMGSVPEIAQDAVKGGVSAANLRGIYSADIDKALIESMHKFGYTMKDFDSADAMMLGVESRTSSPVRILRGDDEESDIKGLYPCGEGAGYAGGITSAASDGIRCAVSIIEKYHPTYQTEGRANG